MKKLTILVALSLSAWACDRSQDAPQAEEPAAEPGAAVAEELAQEEAPEEAEEPAATTVAIGKPAPDFTLTDDSGHEHTLSQYRGKVVVLEWTNPDCPFVVRSHGSKLTQSLDEKFDSDDVVWLAVDSSHFVKPEDSKKWRQEHDINYPFLQDPSGTVGRLYDAKTTPHMFVIDRQGVLRYNGALDDNPRGTNEEVVNYTDLAITAVLEGNEVEHAETKPWGCTVKYKEAS